jgi:hypothetical protein
MESEIVEHTRNATPGLGDIQRWLSLHGYGWFASALFGGSNALAPCRAPRCSAGMPNWPSVITRSGS